MKKYYEYEKFCNPLWFSIVAFGFGVVLLYSCRGFCRSTLSCFIFQSVSITGILALGVTATLVVDGFDLSIGSVATTALMLSAYVMVVLEMSAFTAIIACLIMGAFVGLVMGF